MRGAAGRTARASDCGRGDAVEGSGDAGIQTVFADVESAVDVYVSSINRILRRKNLSEIDIPILMWHGALDENVKVETARYVSENLPNCTPVFMEQEGHLSLIYTHAEEIFKTLLKQE